MKYFVVHNYEQAFSPPSNFQRNLSLTGNIIDQVSSLHWIVLLTNCSFSYNGVYYNCQKLSIYNILVKKVARL